MFIPGLMVESLLSTYVHTRFVGGVIVEHLCSYPVCWSLLSTYVHTRFVGGVIVEHLCSYPVCWWSHC